MVFKQVLVSALIASVLLLAPHSNAEVSEGDNCSILPVEHCPSRLIEKCNSDRNYLETNSAPCLKAVVEKVTQNIPEPADCTPSETCRKSQCLKEQKIKTEVEVFLNACGASKCPSTFKKIRSDLGKLSITLRDELGKFGEILRLDPKSITQINELCKYTTEQIDSFSQQASADPQKLTVYTAQIQFLRECGEYVVHFVENAEREEWSGAIRDQLIRNAKEDNERARQESSTAETDIQKLREAPSRIKQLREIHKIGC